jgi:hypothetical protein
LLSATISLFHIAIARKKNMTEGQETMTENKQLLRIKTSMYIAFVGGILTPLLETVRRWNQISDIRYFINWFDDYIIGGFLFFAARATYKSVEKGRKYLIASWGFATGMSFYSFFSQLQAIDRPDPAPVSSSTVAIVKGIMFLVCIISLVFSLNDNSIETK